MSDLILPPERPARAVAAPTDTSPAALLALAVQKGASVEQMTQLLALQERFEATQAKKEYDLAFSAFKSEATSIIRNKTITDGPLKGKRYAELSEVNDTVSPLLSKHGLSTSWTITKDEKDWIEVTCTLRHSAGHSERVSMGGPPDTGGAKTPLQARMSTISLLERYTLKAVTGTSEAGQDQNADHRTGAVDPALLSEIDQTALDILRAAAMDGEAALQTAFQASAISDTGWNIVRESLIDAAKKADAGRKPAAKVAPKAKK